MTIYGCTAGCSETFTNSLDWRRHENAVHYIHECWLCTELAPNNLYYPPTICLQVFYRASEYESHVSEVHGITRARRRDVEEHRLPTNAQTRFWCGFCRRIVELRDAGLDAWAERYAHLESHFEGTDGIGYRYQDYVHYLGD